MLRLRLAYLREDRAYRILVRDGELRRRGAYLTVKVHVGKVRLADILLLAQIVHHVYAAADGVIALVELLGAVDAASVAGARLDEAVVYASLVHLREELEDILRALLAHKRILAEDVRVVGQIRLNVLHDALEDRINGRGARVVAEVSLLRLRQLHAVLVEPRRELLEGHDAVDIALLRKARLLNLRNARREENYKSVVAVLPPQESAVRLHRRKHRREMLDKLRKMLLHEKNDGRAAGRNHIVHRIAFEDTRVLLRHRVRADRRLLHGVEAEALKRARELVAVLHAERGEIRRRERGYLPPRAVPHRLLDASDVVDERLRVLRTVAYAAPAENALVLHNLDLAVAELDRLHRADFKTLVAVLAVGLRHIDILHFQLPMITSLKNSSTWSGSTK